MWIRSKYFVVRSDFVLYNFNLNCRLSRIDYERISNVIVQYFPSEDIDTYYVPAASRAKARGKLFDAFNHQRSKLFALGIIKHKSTDAPPDVPEILEEEEFIEGVQDLFREEELRVDLNFLETHIGPWDEIRDAWLRTADRRRTILNDFTIDAYLNKFPCLRTNNAGELVSCWLRLNLELF